MKNQRAAFTNSLTAQLINTEPYYAQGKTFSTFKYYVKETSQEYYNICLDRFYDAEDGNIWLSFPSAERNKIDEETFLILKKEHDSNNAVTAEARYKVIAIENEAPQFLKETKLSMGVMPTEFFTGGIPIEGTNEIWVKKTGESPAGFDEIFGENTRTESSLLLRVLSPSNQSNYYKVSTFGLAGSNNDYVRIVSSKPFGEDMFFTTVNPDGSGGVTTGLSLELLRTETLNKAEFTGRFFVKVNEDASLRESVVAANAASNPKYVRKAFEPVYYLQGSYTSRSFWRNNWLYNDAVGGRSRMFIDKMKTDCGENLVTRTGLGISGGSMDISYSGGYGRGRTTGGIYQSRPALVSQLSTPGTLFRFIDAGNGISDPDGQIYQIKTSKRQLSTCYDCKGGGRFNDELNQLARWSLTFVQVEDNFSPLSWNPVTASDGIVPWTDSSSSNWANAYVGIEFLGVDSSESDFTTTNPAIFETEPKEATELDIYYEIAGNYPMSEHGDVHKLDWFNCYSFGNGVESDRIRDDYNASTINNGVKASAVLDEPYQQETRSNGLIFSQIFNSTSGVNGLNQFIQAEGITKDVNPEYGSIQKLYARDTDLITLCENKAMKILASKDALFNADGSSNVTSNRAVLGQTITYQGEYGIGTNPESFAEFGFRMYFVDSNRGTVIRLSNDGITPVSDYGMHGFFQDNLSINKKIIGSWDADTRNYNVTFNNLTPYWQQTLGAGKTDRLNKDPECGAFVNEYPTYSTTVSFKDDLNGWTSRKTYIPENGISLNNVYYTFKSGKIWEMNSNTSYNNFYGIGPSDVSLGSYYESSFTAIFNESPTSVKDFRTISYSGTDSREYIYKTAATGAKNFSLAQVQAQQLIPTEFSTTKGWYANSIITDLQEGEVKELINKEGKYYNYIKGLPTFFVDDCDNNVDSQEFNVQGIGRASAITGNTAKTSFTVTNKIDPDCSTN